MLTETRTFDVVTENRGGHDGAATGGHYGSWARVWASRPGIVRAETAQEHHEYRPGRLAEHFDQLTVRLILTALFDPERDYLVVEHKRSPNPYLRGSPRREGYELLAGTMPAWADFPSRWQEWVHAVRESAVEYLVRYAAHAWSADDSALYDLRYGYAQPTSPRARLDLLDAVQYAERKRAQGTIISAWQEVARLVGINPDQIPVNSWTAVHAMPIRIASRLGWKPPQPRPQYQRPEESGRVLVAGPDGPVS